MSRLVEYVNPHPYTVQIAGPNKEVIRVNKFTKVVLSDWFIDRYTPKFLRVVRILSEGGQQSLGAMLTKHEPKKKVKLLGSSAQKRVVVKRKERVAGQAQGVRSGRSVKDRRLYRRRNTIVGKALAHASELYNQAIQDVFVPVSNGIGIGILSFNRLPSLQRLVNSIRKFTDLSRTTVFVSDDGSDNQVKEWLSHQHDIVAITNRNRIGISGNTNRLLRCLARFKNKILLNDDVEVLASGWERFYTDAMQRSGFHHFCFRQPGLYGAGQKDGAQSRKAGVTINTITEKPHGAVLAFDDLAFEKVGFFDESLDQYGMEHVDWSNRIGLSGIQPPGFHDVAGSDAYFAIHREKSALPQKGRFLRENRARYESLKGNKSRIYVKASTKSMVPKVTIVTPIRDVGRSDSIRTVLNNIRAQRFPAIEMILVEQDFEKKFHLGQAEPIKYIFVPSHSPNQDFNKSKAFNTAMQDVTSEFVILHDADIVVQADYVKKVMDILKDFEGCHIGARVMYLDTQSTAQMCHSGNLDRSYTCERAVGYFEGGSIGFRTSAYFTVGGFNEAYEGYGCEDCDYFERLRDNTRFFNQRSIDMFHLWHSRIPGWVDRHKTNKKLAENILRTMKGQTYLTHLKTQMQTKYPASKKYYV
jgi:GT2 family glycosyltransferase